MAITPTLPEVPTIPPPCSGVGCVEIVSDQCLSFSTAGVTKLLAYINQHSVLKSQFLALVSGQ